MKRTILGQLAGWTIVAALAAAFLVAEQPVSGAEGKTPIRKAVGKRVRRLPAHYNSVVTEKQREEIYKIQEEYQPKIDALENQLNALKKERDDKISAVLTAEQKKQVEEAAAKKAAAKAAAKDKNAAKDAKPAEPAKKETPPAPPENEKSPK